MCENIKELRDKCTIKEAKFIDFWVTHGLTKPEAYKKAGYKATNKNYSVVVSAIREQNEMLGFHREKAPNESSEDCPTLFIRFVNCGDYVISCFNCFCVKTGDIFPNKSNKKRYFLQTQRISSEKQGFFLLSAWLLWLLWRFIFENKSYDTCQGEIIVRKTLHG